MKKRMMKLLTILVVAVPAVYALSLSFFFAMSFSRRFPLSMEHMMPAKIKDNLKANKQKLYALPQEEVEMMSFDGLKLAAHYIPADAAVRTVIMCHGWRSGWDIDFSAIALWLHENNCNLLMIEERGQGKSEGAYMSYGVWERKDIADWANWCVQNRSHLPLYLFGTSMGGASVLMAAGEELPAEVHGIIADSAFTSPYDELTSFGRRIFHLPEHPFMDSLNWMCRKRIGFDLKECSSTEALANSTLPVLLFHGTSDSFVTSRMAQENANACGNRAKLFLFEGVNHCSSFAARKDEYKKAVLAFFAEAERE